MIKKSLTNLTVLNIVDKNSNKTFYGCNQEWYPNKRKRISGCGPSVASNLLFYAIYNKCPLEMSEENSSKEKWVSFMDEVWEFVTPTYMGVHTTKIFYRGVLRFTKLKGLNVQYWLCDMSVNKYRRPKLSKVVNFLEEALTKDTPIAFLNLSSGREKNLDPWHWVTIVSIEYKENMSAVYVDVLDNGMVKKINLSLWYDTTILGGGFVYFTDLEGGKG